MYMISRPSAGIDWQGKFGAGLGEPTRSWPPSPDSQQQVAIPDGGHLISSGGERSLFAISNGMGIYMYGRRRVLAARRHRQSLDAYKKRGDETWT